MKWKEKFKDTKEVIRSRKSKEGQTILYNGQRKMDVSKIYPNMLVFF
jgi:hypothetical protein